MLKSLGTASVYCESFFGGVFPCQHLQWFLSGALYKRWEVFHSDEYRSLDYCTLCSLAAHSSFATGTNALVCSYDFYKYVMDTNKDEALLSPA